MPADESYPSHASGEAQPLFPSLHTTLEDGDVRSPGSRRSESVSEEEFFFAQSLDLLSVLGLDGYFKRVNPMFTQTLGYPATDFLTTPFLQFVHPDDRTATVAEMEKLTTGLPTLYFENRYQTQDGQYRWLAWTASPQVDRGVIYCVARDITQQKATEAALQKMNETLEQRVAERMAELEQINRSLQESEVRFRTALNHIPDVFVIYDAQRRIQFINAAGITLTRRPLSDFLGFRDEDIHPPSVTDAYLPLLKQAVATKTYQTGECTITLPNIPPYTVVVQYVPLLDGAGEIQQILGITHDITQRKQSEEAVYHSAQQLRRVLDGLFSFVGVMTTDGILIEANRTALNAAGLCSEDVLGLPFEETYWWSYSPEIQQQLQQAIARAAAGETVRYDVDVRIRDNQLITIDFTLVPAVNQFGQVECLIPSGIDITERKRTEIALRESEERNERAMEVARMFTFEWELQSDRVRRSPQCAAILGLPDTEAHSDTGINFFQRIHPDDRHGFVDLLHTLTPDNPTYGTTYRVIRPDGGIVFLEESARALFNAQGQFLRLIGMTVDVTQRQRMEAELQDSRATLQRQLAEIETIYQSAPVGLNVLDTNLRFVRINQLLAEINGLPPEAHIGRTVREVLPDLADVAEPILQSILDTGIPQLNVEIVGETPAQPGVQRVWLENFLPLKDGDRVVGINTVCQEITERKRTEETLRQFNLLIELSYEPIFVWDVKEGVISWNQGCEQLYGYTREEAIGHNSRALLRTSYPIPELHFMELLERDRQWSGELTHITRSGKQVIVESRQQLIEANGRKLVLETNRDITIRKHIEVERQQTEEALRRSEERYRLLFESMEDGFCVIELMFDAHNHPIDYRFVEVNSAFAHQTGLQQAAGKTARQLLPRLESHWFETYGRVALTGEPIRFESGSEAMNRWFDVHAFRIGDPNQRRVALLFKEVSDRKAIEAQREQFLQQEQAAREAAERANRIKDEFLAVLSHELRTPLNPILGWAKLLQAPRITPEKLHQGLTTIERNAKQQVQLIDDLLDISRIIRGKLSLTFTAVPLSTPILAALETVCLTAEAKAIPIEVLLDPTLEPVQGDAARLQQVVWNLLSNAIKFTPTGGRIEVRLDRITPPPHSPTSPPLAYAQLTVRDTGKGIHPDFLPHVFELFRQQDSSTTRSFGGLGLGLAIARQVVEAHGGTIMAASAGEGQGATFTVHLPLLPTSSGQDTHLPTHPSSSLHHLRVLVVDDEVDSLDLIKIILEQEGAIVQPCTTPSEVMRQLLHHPFDLLISDIGMPDMNGYVLLHQIRSLSSRHNREIPAIALTAYAGEANQRQAFAAGFQAHLAKPIDPQQLLDAITALTLQR